jgi:phosphoglycolate phosphatase
MAKDIRQIRPFEGIGEMLQCLSAKGVALTVVTSNAYDNVYQVLGPEHAALIRYYEHGVSLSGKRGNWRVS